MHHQKHDVLPRMLGMWQTALIKLCNAPLSFFNGKHQPCLYCGGKDRARWTDNLAIKGDGGNICNQCGNDSGIGLFMRLRGESYSEAIDTLGDWLNLVPVEVISKANKRASSASGYSFGSQAPHENCVAVMERTKGVFKTPLSVFEGIAPPDDEMYSVGVKTLENGGESLIHAIPCHLVHDDGLDDEMCNILMIDEEGEQKFYAKDYTRGSVAVTGKTDNTIYLCVDWVDAQHIHLSTGQEVWACFSSYNVEIVAHRYKGDRKMRVVCKSTDQDVIITAEERGLDVMLPINDNFRQGIERKLYKPETLLPTR